MKNLGPATIKTITRLSRFGQPSVRQGLRGEK